MKNALHAMLAVILSFFNETAALSLQNKFTLPLKFPFNSVKNVRVTQRKR